MESWPLIASVAHLAAIFATVVLAIGHYGSDAQTSRSFRNLAPIGVLLVLFAGAALGANINSQHDIVYALVFGMTPLGLAFIGLVPVIEWEPFPPPRQWLLLLALCGLGWMWSFGSLEVLRVLTGFKEKSDSLFGGLAQTRPWEYAAFCLFALAMAFIEEGVFRGGCFAVWRRYRMPDPAIVLLSSAVWALGHTGYTDVPFVKEVQIFGLGIIYGMARLRLGLWAAVILHLLHNGVTVATSWSQL